MKNIREVARGVVNRFENEKALYDWGNNGILGFFVGQVFKELEDPTLDNFYAQDVIKIVKEELETIHVAISHYIEDEEESFTASTLSKGGPIVTAETRDGVIEIFERMLTASNALYQLEGFKRHGTMRKLDYKIIYHDLHV